jgi:hypothetical protein
MSDDKPIEGSRELGYALETMINVLYLIRQDRHNPDRVQELTEMADVQLERMAQVLQREVDRSPFARPTLS